MGHSRSSMTVLMIVALAAGGLLAGGTASAQAVVTRTAGPFKYLTEQVTTAPSTNIVASLQCPAGYRATGGGGSVASVSASLTFVRPVDTAMSPDPDAYDGFLLGGYNASSTTTTGSVTAVCVRDTFATFSYDDERLNAGTGPVYPIGDTVSCAGQLVGGGVGMGGANQSYNHLYQTDPHNSTTWEWSGFKANTTDSPTYQVEAVCIPSDTRHVRYVRNEVVLDEFQTRSLSVHCPARSHVSAGGVNATFAKILRSGPIDGTDADHTPDDGWSAKVVSDSVHPEAFRVQAICVT